MSVSLHDAVDGERLGLKLGRLAPLGENDLQILNNLKGQEEYFPAHTDIIVEGEVPRTVFLVLNGMACRYRTMRDGSRQITSFLLPGDMCDMHVFQLKRMDHSISALTRVNVLTLAREDIVELLSNNARIAAGLWRAALQEESILRERIVSLGRRDGRSRIAYLICEFLWRTQAVGLASERAFDLPLTQIEIADALGLTPVHVSRILKRFRDDRILDMSHRRVTIYDLKRLRKVASLSPDYLHLNDLTADDDGPAGRVATYAAPTQAPLAQRVPGLRTGVVKK